MNNNFPIILKIMGWITIMLGLVFLIYLIGVAFLLKGLFDVSKETIPGGQFAFWIFIALGSLLPLMEFMLGRLILKGKKFAVPMVLIVILFGIGVALRQTGTAQIIDLIITGFHAFILITLLYYRKLYGYQF